MEGLAEGRRSAPCHVACKNERMVAGEGKKHFFLRKGFPSARGALEFVRAFFHASRSGLGRIWACRAERSKRRGPSVGVSKRRFRACSPSFATTLGVPHAPHDVTPYSRRAWVITVVGPHRRQPQFRLLGWSS